MESAYYSLLINLIYIVVPCLLVLSSMKFFSLQQSDHSYFSCILWQSLKCCFPNFHPLLSSHSTPSPWVISSTHTSLTHHILAFLLSSKPTFTPAYCSSLLGCFTGIINSTHPKLESFLASLVLSSLPDSNMFLLICSPSHWKALLAAQLTLHSSSPYVLVNHQFLHWFQFLIITLIFLRCFMPATTTTSHLD